MKIYELTLRSGQRIRCYKEAGRMYDLNGRLLAETIGFADNRKRRPIKSIREVGNYSALVLACEKLFANI